MTCLERESAILMLVHGELKGIPKLRTRFHLLFCRHCRARMDDFLAVSQSLAVRLENPRLGSRKIVRPSVIGLAVGLLTLLGATIALIVIWVHAANSENCQPIAPQKKIPTPYKYPPH